jgi:hypothetical protein
MGIVVIVALSTIGVILYTLIGMVFGFITGPHVSSCWGVGTRSRFGELVDAGKKRDYLNKNEMYYIITNVFLWPVIAIGLGVIASFLLPYNFFTKLQLASKD